MDSQQQPSRRRMDMGPRRSMDMRAPRRPADAVAPVQQPAQRSVRPVQPQQLPQRPIAPQGLPPRPMAPESAPAPSGPKTRRADKRAAKRAAKAQAPRADRGGWGTLLQVFVGLIVIAAVSSAIVLLYIKYYQ